MGPLNSIIQLAAGNGQALVPPQNLEAEEAVLGALMVSSVSFNSVFGEIRLETDDFYRERHRLVFEAIRALYNEDEPVDALTVAEQLAQTGKLEAAGGQDEVSLLASTTPAPGNAGHYARIVKENALLRRLLTTAQAIQQSVHVREAEPRDLVEAAERALFEVAHAEHTSDFRDVGEILEEELEKLEELSKGDGRITGVPTGFRDLDELTGGLQKGNLIVIAARPSMGKSSLVCNIAENVSTGKGTKEKGTPVAFFSLEMSQTELAHRFIASQARIQGDKLRKGMVSAKDWPKVLKACNDLEQAPLWIDDSADLGMLDLRAKARRLHAQEVSNGNGGLGLIIVDYLQLMRAEDFRQNRVEQVGQISRGLKLLAKELDIPVIGLSQLSRRPEDRPDKRPILSDLRESGNIEQDADVVAFIYRDDVYKSKEDDDDLGVDEDGIAELIIRKHRNGPIDTIKLVFRAEFPKFLSYSSGQQPMVQRPGEEPIEELAGEG